jgi:hypothetical protein
MPCWGRDNELSAWFRRNGTTDVWAEDRQYGTLKTEILWPGGITEFRCSIVHRRPGLPSAERELERELVATVPPLRRLQAAARDAERAPP